MKNRFLARPLAVLLMMVLLTFSQFVAAAYACADALASLPAATMQMSASHDCDDMNSGEQPLICKAHCQTDSQSEAYKTPLPPVPQLFTLFWLAPLSTVALPLQLQPAESMPALLASSPPLRIQYQVFRN